jgi:ubiquinone/menaquinone biosynthesis C-methylase UbiE
MIRWARRSDACSDTFVDFCREHAVIDRHDNVNRYWEYPWAFTHSRLRSGMRVLDAGAGYSAFLLYLAEIVPNAEYHAADPVYDFHTPAQLPHVRISKRAMEELDYPDNHFDLVFCLSVIEHLNIEVRRAAIRQLARCLRPGGRVVLTVDYFLDWPRWQAALDKNPRMATWLSGSPDVAKMIADSGLELLDPARIDPHPGLADFDERLMDNEELWWSDHIGTGLRVTSVGIVLYKPLILGEDRVIRLRIAPEALHLRDDGTPLLGVHHGPSLRPRVNRYPLPHLAVAPAGFTPAEIVDWLGGTPEAEKIVMQALRWGNLRPVDPPTAADAYQAE